MGNWLRTLGADAGGGQVPAGQPRPDVNWGDPRWGRPGAGWLANPEPGLPGSTLPHPGLPTMRPAPLLQTAQAIPSDVMSDVTSPAAQLFGPAAQAFARAGLPPGPGPATPGTPYPTAPTADPGSTIFRQRLDPTTVLLSNQPPAAEASPPPAYPTPAAETFATQAPGPTLRGLTPQEEPRWETAERLGPSRPVSEEPMTAGERANVERGWRRDFRTLDHLLRRSPDEIPPTAFGWAGELIRSGAVYWDEQTGGWSGAIEHPGGAEAVDRLTNLLDRWRDRFVEYPRPTWSMPPP